MNSFNQLQSKPPKGKSFFICFFTFSFLHCVLYIYFSILPFSLQGVIRYDLLANPMSGDMCVASSRKCCSYCPTPVAGWSRSHPCPPAGRWSTRQRGCDTLWTTILAPPPLKTPDQALSQGKKSHTLKLRSPVLVLYEGLRFLLWQIYDVPRNVQISAWLGRW